MTKKWRGKRGKVVWVGKSSTVVGHVAWWTERRSVQRRRTPGLDFRTWRFLLREFGLWSQPRLNYWQQVLGALQLLDVGVSSRSSQLAFLDVRKVGSPCLESIKYMSRVHDGSFPLWWAFHVMRCDEEGTTSNLTQTCTCSHSSLKKSSRSILVTTSRSTVISSSKSTCNCFRCFMPWHWQVWVYSNPK